MQCVICDKEEEINFPNHLCMQCWEDWMKDKIQVPKRKHTTSNLCACEGCVKEDVFWY